MKFMLSLLAIGYVAIATPAPSLPVHPGGIGGLFKGPNSETIIKGPDGSIITSAAAGGEVQTKLDPIIVAEPISVEETPPIVQAVAVPEAIVENEPSSDLIGPSGRIATKGSQSVIAGPASTTITGPTIVADTIVKGPPIIATSGLDIGRRILGPVATIGTPAIAGLPLLVTPTPLSPIAVGISPISVTASPIATVTASAPSPTISTAEFGRTALVSIGTPISVAPPPIATVTATPPVATVTAIPQVAVTATPRTVATASTSPHLSVATASGGPGASATATAVSNLATARVETVTVTPFVVPSPVTPLIINGHGLVGINDRFDLGSQLLPDQIAIDNNRRLNLNPALIPSGNLIPPEISLTPRIPVERLRSTPGTLLTTPGLGKVANSNNIQRGEGDYVLSSTPNSLQVGLTPEILSFQNRQGLLQNQLQHAQTLDPNIQTSGESLNGPPNSLRVNSHINFTPEQVIALQNRATNIQEGVGTLSVTPNSIEVDSQGTLSADKVAVLQNQQILLHDQAQRAQQAASSGIVQSTRFHTDGRRNQALFTPTIAEQVGNIPQESLLAEELTKSGIDASQLQLTNIPLSAVSGLPSGTLRHVGINDGLGGESWGRYGRDVETDRKEKSR